ncbi:MAG TPA: ribonuclease H-like domain-containing protein [Terriglobales bacterium]|nr:ribonuclease H-like domain-containing protein [Terriglobales bacterium]
MLRQTFIHIPGIGKHTERDLWSHGIRSWEDADRFEKRFGFVGARLQEKLDQYIPQSWEAVRRKDAGFFERLTALGEAWRVFPEFADECVYLDIETTGMSTVFDSVTLVGLYDGRKYKVFVEGQNLDDLPKELQKHSVVVTFNGSGFDLRFLRLAFPDMAIPPVHIDLRWVMRRLGYTGGLKEVEKRLRIRRAAEVEELSGFDATVLWARYQRGDQSALERLIQYNTEDVVHLKAIVEIAYDKLSRHTATFLNHSIAPVFTGVAELPRARKSTATRAIVPPPAESNLVSGLLRKTATASPRIVGIDLTGSAKRATGWALMVGAAVSTRPLHTDDELVKATVESKPDLVSIDSPLSFPEGVVDPDKLGDSPIYRKCELALKRMGISVFWCLLPTMKGLTTRGMRLAQRLREAGLTVIESYPGAAQDLLGIPRKGASLEELKWGLHRAGIEGSFLTEKISHDEVDAITSALVGLFYLADDFIALGTPAEDYLIVPRSPKINYPKLSEILKSTGLDALGHEAAH